MLQLPENENSPLVHWTYSYDEWRKFERWQKLRKGILHFASSFFMRSGKTQFHTIQVGQNQVCIDGTVKHFQGNEIELRRINISEVRNMNVMEISFHHIHDGTGDIRIPIPRGCLREAIALEERLNQMRISQQDSRQ